MTAMEMDKLPFTEGEIQTGGRGLPEPDRSAAAVSDAGGAGDHILLCKYTVKKFHFHTYYCVTQRDGQRLALASEGGGEPLQRVLAGPDLMAHVSQIRAELAGCCLCVDSAQTEIPAVCAAVLLRHSIK